MNTVKDILTEKGKNVYSVAPHTTLLEALKKLRDHNVGFLVVIDDGKVKGIISERDFAYRIAEKSSFPLNEPVSAWMTQEIIAVTSSTTIIECMQLMSREHVRHLPVVDDGKLAGIVSIGDVVKAEVNGKQSTILGLDNYILNRPFEN